MASFLLYCNPNNQQIVPAATGVAPGMPVIAGNSVALQGVNLGDIQQINLNIVLPPGNQGSLFDIQGQVTLTGSVTFTGIPCLSTANVAFTCQAQLAVGNITAQSCNINGQNVYLRLFISRGNNVVNPYSILGAEVQAPPSCYNPNSQFWNRQGPFVPRPGVNPWNL